MRMSIIVQFSFMGVHSWPDAPDGPEAYLRHPHRHIFYVEAMKDVSHENRDIEFIALKNQMWRECKVSYGSEPTFFSCESMAIGLLKRFKLRTCRVLEDNENGAEVSVDELDGIKG